MDATEKRLKTAYVSARANLLEHQAAKLLGRLGGQSKSRRKAAASRKNGQKGGWPKGRPRKAPPVAQEALEGAGR